MKSILATLLLASSLLSRAGDISKYNVVWDSPSANADGSMPLGNGDIGLNAWVEPSGDLLFYIGKTDAWSEYAQLYKVGLVRVAMDPTPEIAPFRQTLDLATGSMRVEYGDGTQLILWVDANRSTIEVEINGPVARKATCSFELWRTEQKTSGSHEVSDILRDKPGKPPMILEPDTILTGLNGRIGWYHHNPKSVGPEEHAMVQGIAEYPRQDPLLHRTFGAVITSPAATRLDDTHLESRAANAHRFDIHVLTLHPALPEEWLRAMETQIANTLRDDIRQRRAAHGAWWQEFWNRSWIEATGTDNTSPIPSNNRPLKTGEDQNGRSRFAGEIREMQITGDLDGEFTLTAEVKPGVGATGRIFDKIQPGGRDGFLLDILSPNTLRLILGGGTWTVKNVLPEGDWSSVSLTCAKGQVVVRINGEDVLTAPPPDTRDEGAFVSQMYALQRFITAGAGRGAYPIKFNGSIFTTPHHGNPDYRRWGPGYWWQNTRLPYFSMCASGDFEMLEPLFRMYADVVLPLNIFRTEKYFGFKNAAYFAECITFWGDVFNETYGWTPVEKRKDPLQTSPWHKWEWVGGPEFAWIMIEAYTYTGNEGLLQKRIIPTVNAIVRFFDLYYKTNDEGKLVMHPSMACETWWNCTNPMPEVAGLRAILGKMLALPPGKIPQEIRESWQTFLAKLPPLPTRELPDGQRALAPAEHFARKANIENPELYAVFPFRLCSFDQENSELGVQALKNRWDRGNHGWRQDDIFMAYLGLTQDAQQYLLGRARGKNKANRFPAFWGPNYDWNPDQTHGGVLMKTFQSMLMQADGDKIFLLPAWPPEWDVDFKLHAPNKTIVEGRVRDGKVQDLRVIPESRKADVVIVPNAK